MEQRSPDPEQLKQFFLERLKGKGITSIASLGEAVANGGVDLRLSLDDFISPERQKEILEQNPDSWQVGDQSYPVTYSESYSGKFSASVEIPAKEILKITELPPFLQGRAISIKAGDINFIMVSDEGNLEELKLHAKVGLIDHQWKEWEKQNRETSTRELDNFDPSQPLPELPPPLEYGKDPVTSEPLLAYPAIVAVAESIYQEPTYCIRYFQSKTTASLAQLSLQKQQMRTLVPELDRRTEIAEKAAADANKLLAELTSRLNTILANPKKYGVDQISFGLAHLRYLPTRAQQWARTEYQASIFAEMQEEITKYEQHKKDRDAAKEKVSKAVEKYYPSCPLCNQPLKEGKCSSSSHNTDLIKWNVDEDGNNIGPAKLSQIEIPEGKIAVALFCSLGTKKHPKGEVYLVTGEPLGEGRWQNEPFADDPIFKDSKKIMTPDQVEGWRSFVRKAIEKRKAEINLKRYQEMQIEAEKKVREGLWQKGKFGQETDPRNGETHWVRTVPMQGAFTLKYIVGSFGVQPSLAEEVYYFSRDPESMPRSAQGGIQIIQVNLEHPLPEERPSPP